ncbi:MAG: Calx-beta domain-containing protein [Acidobacteriota bacterium]
MSTRTLIALFVSAAPALLTGPLHAQSLLPAEIPTYEVSVTDGVVYGTADVNSQGLRSKELLLDLYQPLGAQEATSELSPVLVLVHGGGFVGGSRKEGLLVNTAQQMAARGWVVASIDYRLGTEVPVPSPRMQALLDAALAGVSAEMPVLAAAQVAAVEDTLTAVEWLAAQAESLGIEPTQVGVLGTSAGAITAVHAAYLVDDHGVAAPRFSFVVDLWGGSLIPADNRVAAARFLESGEPPLFVVHGTEDPQVDFELAELLVGRADNQGVPYEFYPLQGVGHGVNLFQVDLGDGLTLFERMTQWARSNVQQQRADARSLAFEVSEITVSESSGSAELTVRRLGSLSGIVGATVVTKDGSARADADYVPVDIELVWQDADGQAKTVQVDLLDDGLAESVETFGVQLTSPSGGAALVSPSALTVTIEDDDQVVPTSCVTDETTSCLLGGRFRITGFMNDSDGREFALRVMSVGGQPAETDTTVFFESFIPGAVEYVFKMVDGCELTGTFWGFLSGTLTDQQTALRVEDTATGLVRTYANASGQVAAGFQDTSLFATCYS